MLVNQCNNYDMSEPTTVVNSEGVEIAVPPEFCCPITLLPMVHPVINRNGHNFERDEILSWLESHPTCPLTRLPMRPSNFISNKRLADTIKLWRLINKIDDGAQQVSKGGGDDKQRGCANVVGTLILPEALENALMTSVREQTTTVAARQRRRISILRRLRQ